MDLTPRTMAQVATFKAVLPALEDEELHRMLMLLLSIAYLEGKTDGVRQMMDDAVLKEKA